MGEAGPIAQLGDMTRGLAGLVWPRRPFELFGADDAIGHGGSLVAVSESSQSASDRLPRLAVMVKVAALHYSSKRGNPWFPR